VRWSSHARRNLLDREVEQTEAELTLTNPDSIVPGEYPRMIYQRAYFDKTLGQKMLVRIVVGERQKERVVITIYKTSRLDKYRR